MKPFRSCLVVAVTAAVLACGKGPTEPGPREVYVTATRTAGPGAPALVRLRPEDNAYEELVSDASSWIELRPATDPSGTGPIVYQQGYPNTQLMALVPGESPTKLITSGPAFQGWAHYSADGRWVYFVGGGGPELRREIWRVAAVGGAAELVKTTDLSSIDGPTPSPDRSRVALVSDGRLYVLEESSGEVADLGVAADIARWSPVADEIAYLRNGERRLIDPEGTVDRRLATDPVGFSPRNLAWAPDGTALLVHAPSAPSQWNGRLVLVDLDGETTTLGPVTEHLSQASLGF